MQQFLIEGTIRQLIITKNDINDKAKNEELKIDFFNLFTINITINNARTNKNTDKGFLLYTNNRPPPLNTNKSNNNLSKRICV